MCSRCSRDQIASQRLHQGRAERIHLPEHVAVPGTGSGGAAVPDFFADPRGLPKGFLKLARSLCRLRSQQALLSTMAGRLRSSRDDLIEAD